MPLYNFQECTFLLLERKEETEKRQALAKERLKRFKDDIENKMKSYFSDTNNKNLKFSPMDHIYRSIV